MGWPALLVALLLAAAGTWFRKPIAIWTGLALTLPLAIYLSGSPAYPFLGALPVFALVLSALTCRQRRRWPGLAGLGAYAAFLLVLAIIVSRQP